MVRIAPALLMSLTSPVGATDCQVDGYGAASFSGDIDSDSLFKPVTMFRKRMGTLEMCKELCECTRNCGCFRYQNGKCWLYGSDKCTAHAVEPTCDKVTAGSPMPTFLRSAGDVPNDDPVAGVFRRGSRGDTSVPSTAQCVVNKFRTAQHFNKAYKLLGNFDESADDYSLMSCGYYYGYWVGGKYDGKWDEDGYKENVPTAEDCAAQCDQTHDCAGFVWFDEKAYSGWAYRCLPYTEAHWCDQGIYTDTTRSGHRGWSYWRAAGPSTAPMPGGGKSGDQDGADSASGEGDQHASNDEDEASGDSNANATGVEGKTSGAGVEASNAIRWVSSSSLQVISCFLSVLALIIS